MHAQKVYQLYFVSDDNMIFIPTESTQGEKSYPEMWRDPIQLKLETAECNKKNVGSKHLAQPDISYFIPGGIIISQNTVDKIGQYLKQFGEIRPTSIEGKQWYAYNITNVLEGSVGIKPIKS
ncbi:Uncharacterised protein [BD1-7 clade bacterium]|uniref:Uncharacterized protein n=1 Tax=BD1-7 clade bacterium TaxID=2029982 RepID=A0A5S9PC57_9GAMM|nr:Uncharacterised protein [BD1-7 clade bacterium]